MFPAATLSEFDAFLAARGLAFSGVIVGGSAIALLGVPGRQTKDCDVLDPEIPAAVARAAQAFAVERRAAGEVLADGWLNNGPRDLVRVLADGWRSRSRPAFRGTALVLDTLGRFDLLCTKVFALCDRQLDLPDCLALAPNPDELAEVSAWVELQDANPDWPKHVGATIRDLGARLGHGI